MRMLERDLSRPEVENVQDRDAWNEACAVFGTEGARNRLCMFRSDLAGQLARIGTERPDHAALRELAHQTAGRAGLFGFPALAEASADLEEAVRQGHGIAAALERWTRQAGRVAESPPE